MKRRRLLVGFAVVAMGISLWAAWLVGRGSTVALVQPPLALRAEGLAMLKDPPAGFEGVRLEHSGIGDLWLVSVPGSGAAEMRRMNGALARMNALAEGWWEADAVARQARDEAAGYFLVEYMDPVFIVHEKPMPMRGGVLYWKLRERWDGWWR